MTQALMGILDQELDSGLNEVIIFPLFKNST